MDAGHPDYDANDVQNLDGFDTSGGLFGDYPSIDSDSVLGVPIDIVDARIKESTQTPGQYYCVVAAILLKDKMLTPKEEGHDPYQGKAGYKISFNTGAARCVKIVEQMVERGGNASPFPKPYRVMLSKVQGAHPKARTFVTATLD